MARDTNETDTTKKDKTMTQQERFDKIADEFFDFMERKTAWLADIAADHSGIDIEDVEYEEVKEDGR